MKNVIKFLIFIICTIIIFFISDFKVLVILFVLSILIAILIKIRIKELIHNLIVLLPFIVFTGLINALLGGIYEGLLIGVRLILCYNITFIFSKTITALEVANTIEKMCYPLKIFKVNTKNIGMIVSISICMIPVFRNEMYQLGKSMRSKGKRVGINNVSIIMKPMLISILQKTNQIEKAIIAKGYAIDN